MTSVKTIVFAALATAAAMPIAHARIDIATGNNIISETDFTTGGPNPLSHSRRYESGAFLPPEIADDLQLEPRWSVRRPYLSIQVMNAAENDVLIKAFRWQMVYDDPNIDDDEKTRTAAVKYLFWRENGGGWQSTGNATFNFQETDSGYQITTASGRVEKYDGSGKLIMEAKPGRASNSSGDPLPGDFYEYEYYGQNESNPANNGRLYRKGDGFGRWITFNYHANNEVETITDPDGNVYTYQYDENDNLIAVIYPDDTPATLDDNPRRQFHYENVDFPSHITGITDAAGIRIKTFGYDEFGRTAFQESQNGVDRRDYIYNEDNTTTVTDAWGASRTYHFQKIAGVYYVTQVDGPCPSCGSAFATRTYFTDEARAGLKETSTDYAGNVTTYTYNTRRLMTSMTRGSGSEDAYTVNTTWDAELPLPTRVEEPGKVVTMTYHPTTRRLHTRTETDEATNKSRTITYQYYGTTDTTDSSGNVIGFEGFIKTIDGPRAGAQDVTHFTYRADGTVHQVTNALGHVTTVLNVDAQGRPTLIEDANGVTTLLTYDTRGRLTQRLTDGAATQIGYYDNNDIRVVYLPDNSSLAYFYDDARRLEAIEDNLGNRIEYARSYRQNGVDEAGNPIFIGEEIVETVLDSQGNIKRTQTQWLNSLKQLEAVLGANGQQSTSLYNANNDLQSQTVDGRLTTQYTYDALRRIDTVTDPISGITNYEYDAFGNLHSVTDPEDKTTTYTYNALGELVSLQSPDTGLTTYTYDEAGNRISQTDANGITVNYAYDALNRLTRIDHADDTYDVEFFYDEDWSTGAEYTVGRLSRIVDQLGTTRYQYNPRGTIKYIDQQFNNGPTVSMTYAYNAVDQLVSVTYPSGTRIDYSRDALGRIDAVSINENGTSRTLASNFSYLPFGPQTQMQYGNGLLRSRSFDLDYRIADDSVGNVINRTYQYNTDDTIGDIIDALNPNKTQSFTYDDLLRLDTAQGSYGLQDFGYDGIGNRTSIQTGDENSLYNYASGSHHLDAILDAQSSATLTQFNYDNVGNTLQKGAQSFTYNPNNRLEEVYDNGTLIAIYTYNAQGERQKKETTLAAPQGISTTYYHYDQAGQLIAESNGSGQTLREYVYVNGQRLAVLTPDTSITTGTQSAQAAEYDLQYDSQTKQWSLTEINNNQAPVANAGSDQTIFSDESAFLDGRGSSDPDGDTLTYSWSNGDTSSTTAVQFAQAGSYTVTLTVSDGELVATDDVIITVEDRPLESNFNTMHLVGNFNGWSTSNTPMTLIENHTWEVLVDLAAGTNVKFVPVNWGLSFGDVNQDGIADNQGGGNIPVPAPTGQFKVTFNDDTLAYSLEPFTGPQPPVAEAGANQSVKVGTSVTLDASQSTDPDSDITTYAWSDGFGTGMTVSKVMDTVGQFEITLTVTDSEGQTDTDAVIITVNPNQAPSVSAGNDQTVRFDQATITLNGSANDSDGSIASVNWTQTAGDAVTINNANSLAASFANPGVGQYVFELEATDNDGESASDSVSITITENDPPTANAGNDISAQINQTVSFNGSASSDSDGSITSYEWTSTAFASPLTGAQPTYSFATAGDYTVTLTVTDNDGATAQDALTVSINDAPPESNHDTMHLVGNFNGWSLTANPMTLVADHTWQVAVDLSGASVKFVPASWALSYGDVNQDGIADSSGGGNIPVPSGANPYLVTFNDDTLAYSIVLNTGPQPPVAEAGANQSVKVGTVVSLDASQSTDPDNDITTYAWSDGFGAGMTVSKVMDTVGQFEITLTVTDSEGQSDTDSVIITVNPNQAPNVSAGTDLTVRFDQATVTLNGSATDNDGNITSVNWTQTFGDSVVLMNADTLVPTFSNPGVGQYIFALEATDNDGETASDSVTVSITANTPPTANAGSDISAQINQLITFNGSASNDPDGSITSYEWTSSAFTSSLSGAQPTYSFVNAGDYTVTLTVSDNNGATAQDTMTVSVTDAPPQSNHDTMHLVGNFNGWSLTATPMTLVADYTWQVAVDLSGASVKFVPASWALSYGDVNQDGIADSSGGGNIPVPNGANPYIVTFNDDTLAYSIVLNTGPQPPVAEAGANQSVKVGTNVTLDASQSTDPDNDITTYAWSDGFGTGISASKVMDTVGEFEITLTVTDSEGQQDTDTVTISVNANQAPIADAGSNQSVNIGDTVIFNGNGSSDTDGSIVSYVWTSNAWPGELTGAAPTQVFNTEGTYTVTLTVADEEGETDTDTLTVTVSDTPPQSVHSTMHLTGTHNGWSVSSTPMALIDDFTWQVTATFPADARFKFVPVSWALSYGDNNADGIADSDGGGNIEPPSGGTWTITFNDQTKAYTIEAQ